MILAIAKREFRSLFMSPLAWVILAVVQVILAWSFFTSLDVFFNIQSELSTMKNAPGVTDLVISPLYEVASVVLLMITPMLTMRLISEEKRNHTISLLYHLLASQRLFSVNIWASYFLSFHSYL